MADEQELAQLRSAVRDLCEREVGQQDVRATMVSDTGHDPALWRRLAVDLGVLGLAVPEEHGGTGSGLAALCVVAEELGRALLPAPLLGTVGLAAPVLALAGDDATLARVLEGDLLATVVAQDTLGRWAPGAVTSVAEQGGDGVRLTGTSTHVVDGAVAGLLLVGARLDGGVAVVAVDPSGPGCRVEPLSTMDLTRRQATVVLDGASGTVLVGPDRGQEVLERAGDLGAVLLGAMQVGVAQRLLELSVQHARTRFQFGRPIGAFQGVKHRCAHMFVAVETARSTVLHAAEVADSGGDGLALATSLAAATASDAGVRVGADAVQVHGGLGFTWEHPVHLYYKRAVGDAALLGSAAEHRDRVARLVLDETDETADPTVFTPPVLSGGALVGTA